MKLKTIFHQQDDQDDQWISIADMMAGLMIVFLFIAIVNLKDQLDKLRSFEILQDRIYNELYNEFENDLKKWVAEIDKETLTVSFREPKIQFATGSSEVKNQFKDILDDFYPRYLNVLWDFREDIEELRIEGHTSSKWQKATSIDEAYINNMGLSQDRSKNVLIYILGLDLGQNKKWAKEKIIANGMSFSKLLMRKNGTEDATRSQRTEFRVKVDSTYIIEKLRKAFQEQKNET